MTRVRRCCTSRTIVSWRGGRTGSSRSATAPSSPDEVEMASSLLRKSITDLSRRKSRTFFTVATLTLAVMSVGLFALPTLMDRSMQAVVASDRLPDLSVDTQTLRLDQAQLAALAAVRNVRAVEPASFFSGRMYVGARR